MGSDEQTCEMVRACMAEESLNAETLLRAAQSLNKDFAGICPILSNDTKNLTLTLRPDIVKRHEPGSKLDQRRAKIVVELFVDAAHLLGLLALLLADQGLEQ